MFKRLIILLTLIAGFATSASAASASDIMRRAADAIIKAKTATADFTVSDGTDLIARGSIAVSGNKYAVRTAESESVYDGSTQWTVNRTDREISIYEPTAEEVAQVNPFAIIRAWDKNYKCRLSGKQHEGIHVIELTPKASGSSIARIILRLDSAKLLPRSVDLTLDDGTLLKISVTNVVTGANIPASKFVVNPKSFPGFDIIDLR